MVPTGGSKADGTIDLSYEVGMLEKPVIDRAQAYRAANQRCAAWGYEEAEAFGGATSTCISNGSYGCNRTRYTVTFQCMD
ncbi:YecR family lipoprotein [Onishia taeanensis]